MLTSLDLLVFFVSLAAVMAIGLYAARHEDTADDFFLAGRSVRWWGGAGSIFGSNVSANHLVGMLGVGYSIGFPRVTSSSAPSPRSCCSPMASCRSIASSVCTP